MPNSPDVIPPHQLCTDCRTRKRALAEGITGYASLCIPCFEERMSLAKQKHPPKRKAFKERRSVNPSLSDFLDDPDAYRRLIPDINSDLENLDEL